MDKQLRCDIRAVEQIVQAVSNSDMEDVLLDLYVEKEEALAAAAEMRREKFFDFVSLTDAQ